MKKTILIMLLLLPSSIAWNYATHENIAVEVAGNINIENLNFDKIREGAIAPDEVFKDNRLHHYPPSYDKAVFWLEQAKNEYDSGNYNEASYSFGVASHYIADSFADPHYVSGESNYQHSKYENRGYYNFKTGCDLYTTDLNQALLEASEDVNWDSWLETQDSNIPKSRLEDATKALYSVALLTFETSCKESNNFNDEILSSSIVAVILLVIYLGYKKFKSYRK